jgi:plasmid maintenance system antidote protein VapI
MKSITASDLGFAVRPGEQIEAELAASGESTCDLAEALRVDLSALNSVISGESPITAAFADSLARHFGTSAGLWLSLERQYRDALAGGEAPLTETAVRERLARPNGRVALRIPRSLHERVVHVAEEEGVSMNQLLVALIAEGVTRHEHGGTTG